MGNCWQIFQYGGKMKERKKQYSLLLLAGGKSSRMGQNKAQLFYEGKTFMENLICKGRQLGIEQIYVSGYQGERDDVQVVWDIFPDRGPLGGIHACMRQIETPFCLVLPVDVPQIPLEVLEEMLHFHEEHGESVPIVLEHGDRTEYLIGIYPVVMADFIEDFIHEHSASVYRMLRKWGFTCYKMELPQWQVENINTQDAYQQLLEIVK